MGKTMTAKIQFVDSRIAQEIMAKNTNNFRKIDSRRVQQYARQMKNGQWQNNGEPIQIYTDGTLANGQHRLAAIIKSGVAIPLVIIDGIQKNVTTFDVGSKRSLQQIASARGISISTQRAGAIAIILFGIHDRTSRYGADEVLDFYEQIPEIDDIEKRLCHGDDRPMLRRAVSVAAGFCAVKNGVITIDDLDTFSQIANSGIPKDGVLSNAPLCLRKTYQEGFKDVNGMPLTWGARSMPLYFDVTYRAICDFTKHKSPMRSYKPKMTNEEINKVIDKTRDIISQTMIAELNEG